MKSKIVIFVTLLVMLITACRSIYPEMSGNKVIQDESGEIQYDSTYSKKTAKDGIKRALSAKGIKGEYDPSLAMAKYWVWGAFGSGAIGFICLLAWYFTRLREVGGASAICFGFSLFATFMAELVMHVWLVIVLVVLAILFVFGYYIRDWSLIEKLKGKKGNDQNFK